MPASAMGLARTSPVLGPPRLGAENIIIHVCFQAISPEVSCFPNNVAHIGQPASCKVWPGLC